MANWNAKESVIMDQVIEYLIDQITEWHRLDEPMSSIAFCDILEANGYMIVPIEDPTNLRFGVE